VTLQKYFSHQNLFFNFFPTPPIKLKLGLQIGVMLLIATHMDQSDYLANQQILGFVVPFISLYIFCQNVGPKRVC
jgi:hypothetical protein